MEPGVRVTERALAALRAEGIEPAGSCLVVQHVLGCGGSGYRLAFRTEAPEGEGHRFAADGGLTVWMDDYSHARLQGAVIDYDEEKEMEGYYLDHPDAAFAAFC